MHETGADLDAIRAAFVRMIWTLTRGVSDPARRACADPDAREAGFSRPSPPPILSSAGGPAGTRRRPTKTRTSAQVSAAVSLRNQWVSPVDDRPCTDVVIMVMVEGADGQLAIVPPPRPPSSLLRWMLTSGSQGEMGASEKPDLSNGAAAAKMDRSYR